MTIHAPVERTCLTCGVVFTVERWRLTRDPCDYCSVACRGAAWRGRSADAAAVERRAAIIRLYVEEGLTCRQIGERLDMLPSSAWRQLKQAGIPLRPPTAATTIRLSCKRCGETFEADAAESRRRPRTFCGTACANSHAAPLGERFWRFVQKSDGCWLWTGSQGKSGYGRLSGGRRGATPLTASRVSWLLHFGPVPEGRYIMHACDTPACVRPSHLFPGTPKQNAEDMVKKGRHWAHRRAMPEKPHPLDYVP